MLNFLQLHTLVLAENTCTVLGKDMPSCMQPPQAGSLAQFLRTFKTQPPSLPPMPTLNSSSVEEPPLPTVASRGVSDGSSSGGTRTPGTPSDAHTATMSAGMLLVMVFTALLI
jgi:hypothetical protein